jgi:hypothetical protein
VASNPDYILDVSGLPPQQPPKPVRESRPWISVSWNCCSTYSRVYRNKAGDAYEGRCPKCGQPVIATIGPGGTSSRFFEAG